MKTNYHSHTTRCKHAKGTDEQYVLSAIKGGLTEIGFSDHCPWPFEDNYISSIRMDVEQLEDYVSSVRTLQEKYKDQISIKLGLECEYYEEFIPWLSDVKERYQLDYLIFGNHFPENETRSYYFGSQAKTKESLNDYLDTAVKGMESGLFVYLAHPDLFMRCYPSFDSHCESICRQICEKAKELNIPLEYNISGYIYNESFNNPNGFPNKNFWTIAAEVGCTAIIGYDAHDNKVYETEHYRNQALKELDELGIKVIKSLAI